MRALTDTASNARTALLAPGLAVGLVLISAISVLVYLVLTAYAPQLRTDASAGENVLSKSAIGYAGIRSLLEKLDIDVVASREPPTSGQFSLVVLTPELIASDPSRLAQLAGLGPRLIVMPKWSTIPQPFHPGWVAKLGLLDTGYLKALLANLVANASFSREPDMRAVRLSARFQEFSAIAAQGTVDIVSLQTISRTGLEFDVVDQKGRAVLAHVPRTQIFILSDPDLMDNLAIGKPATARIGIEIIRALRVGDKPVSFDLTLNGLGNSPSVLLAVFSPPLLGATLCAILAAVLIGIQSFHRFGPGVRRDRVFAFGKRALADNTAAVIRLMRRQPRMATRFAQTCVNLVAAHAGHPRGGLGTLSWLRQLEQRAGVTRSFSELNADAQQVETVSALLSIAKKLYQWRQEVLNERR